MLVTWDGTWYWAHTEYADRERAKAAGFLWDNAVRKWKTKFPARAALLRPYCDQGALLQLESHFLKLEASRATDSALEIPAPEGLQYLPYQKAGVAYTVGRPATLIADEPGLGKTIQALGLINSSDTITRALVVCPTSLRLNWAREARKWLVRPFEVIVVDGKRFPLAIDATAPVHGPVLVITNYERLVKLQKEFQSVAWDLVVADEAHYIKNPDARRSQVVYEVAMAAKQRVLLTGTPILNKPVELLPLAGLCDPDRFGDPRQKRSPQRWSFLKRYCGAHQEPRGGKMVWVFDGATHLDELQERLRASVMVRRLKADVLGELPPKRRQVVPVEVDMKSVETPTSRVWWEAVQAAEAEAALAVVEADKKAYAEAAAKLRYLNQVAFTEMSDFRHKLGLAKVATGVEYVTNLLDGGVDKVVVFAHHRDVLEAAQKSFSEAGYNPVLLYGGMDDAEKDGAVARFQGNKDVAADPSCRVFLGQIQAAGVGLTLTVASHVVFVELDWVPANTSQCEDRCHRIGQRGVVFVHHLVVDGSLDAHMVQKMVWKQEVAENALDTIPDYENAGAPGSLAHMPEAKQLKSYTTVRKVPAERRAALLSALRFLAERCDGAREKDGSGFNGTDSAFGKKLAGLSDLSDAQFYAGWRLVRKYRKTQLPENLVEELGLASDVAEAA